MMESITLRTGATALLPVVATTMLTLERLVRENPLAFYDLAMLCRDASYRPFGSNADLLESLGMTDRERVDSQVRDIVLAAVEGDDLAMRLVSPVDGCGPQ
jgi:hypothetical protein